MTATAAVIDRMALRVRPTRRPMMYQSWGDLLFAHLAGSCSGITAFIPPSLEIDTYDDHAWIGLVPFTMWGIRKAWMPKMPWMHAFHELNVRTYVHHRGVPGVWFLSLDAAHALAALLARQFFHLPYYHAEMSLQKSGDVVHYQSRRRQRGAAPATLNVSWKSGERLPESKPDSLEFFLTERYCLYAQGGDRLLRGRIWHKPWPLCQASLIELNSSMFTAAGIVEPESPPHLCCAASIDAEIWGLEVVQSS